MTHGDTEKLCELLVHQVGAKPDDVVKSLYLWKINLMTIEYPKAQEALKALMMERTNCKTAGNWLSAIVRYCGGSERATSEQRHQEKNPGCHKCDYCGSIEVPHKMDWKEGRWNGMYTGIVACDCPAGIVLASKTMNMRHYESLFPQWRDEYPRRQLERQLRDMDRQTAPTDKKTLEQHTGRIARIRRELDELDGEVSY